MLSELQAAATAWKASKQRQRYLNYLTIGLFVVVCLLSVSNFITTYMAVELGKEVKANEDVIRVADGRDARIGSSDFSLVNGKLVPTPSGSGARRLSTCVDGSTTTDGVTCSTEDSAVGVRLTTTSQTLSSTIPDSLMSELTKVNVSHSDGSSSITLTITGFSRVSAPSKCGSLVYLDTANGGTITLDDTDMYFDEVLSARLIARGISVAEVTGWGRRLASTSAVTGLFSFFEDYEWECTSVDKPRSPSAPYVSKTLRKTPCPTTDSCTSTYLTSQTLPGYDADDDTIIVEETLVVTDTYTMSIRRFPNHPLQQLVSITDHSAQTHHRYSLYNGAAHRCTEHNYAMEVGNATDALENYTASYLGTEAKAEKVYQLPWGTSTVAEHTARLFTLTPGEDLDGVLPTTVQYEDDSSTLLPTRLFFYGALDLGMDASDIIVLSTTQDADEAATLYNKYKNLMTCDAATDDLPQINTATSAMTESTSNIEFYCRAYGTLADADGLEDGTVDIQDTLDAYWQAACSKIESGSRRLLTRRNPARRLLDKFYRLEIPLGSGDAELALEIYRNNHGSCVTVEGQGGLGWQVHGKLSLGNQCSLSGTGFTAKGSLELSYGWGWRREIKVLRRYKLDVRAELRIRGYIGFETGSYTYNCGRRLAPKRSRGLLTNGSGMAPAEKQGPPQTAPDAEDVDLELEAEEVEEGHDSLEQGHSANLQEQANSSIVTENQIESESRDRKSVV